MRVITSAGIGLLWSFGLVTYAFATNTLVISSPQAGTVVAPGQLLTVTVTVAGSYPNGIALVGGSPGVMEGPQPASNPTFSVTIPANAPAGPFGISAVGSISTGTLVKSVEVQLDVERSDLPQSLVAQPTTINLNFVGDSLSLDALTGLYADGSHLDLRRSSLLQASSSNSAVAVFENGQVVAAGPGNATITFSVGTASQSVAVTVPNSIRGDLNADGRVDNSDVAILNSALNTPDTIANDARDLNLDGQITSADVTILKTLCTVQKPLCATH